MKTNELQGAALDWAVAECDGRGVEFEDPRDPWLTRDGIADQPLHSYTPSTDWAQGGPIIEREKIDLFTEKHTYPDSWCASVTRDQSGKKLVGWRLHQYGSTPLIAAMRCYVASKLGDDVNVPENL